MNESENISVWDRYNSSDLLFFERFAPHVSIIERINYPLWAIPGIPGGILSIMVWSSRAMRRGGSAAAAIYQMFLGVVDVSFFLIQINWYLHVAWQLGILDHPVICQVFPVFNYLIQYLSPCLTFTFTLERYLAIAHPFRSQHYLIRAAEKGAFKVIGIVVSVCLCMASVQAFVFTYTGDQCTTQDYINDPDSIASSLYRNWTVFTEVFYFFCLPVTCLVLNILVIHVLHRSTSAKKNPLLLIRNDHQSGTFSDQTEEPISKNVRSSTFTLLCTSFFVIFNHLSVAVALLLFNLLNTGDIYLTDEQIERDPTWVTYFRVFTARGVIDSFAVSHYAAKFPIYLATSKQFRQEVYKLFCGGRRTGSGLFNTSDSRGTLTPSSHRNSLVNRKRPLGLSAHSLYSQKESPLLNTELLAIKPSRTNHDHNSITPSSLRKRPSPGITRTVIAADGQRIPANTGKL
ncbi:unnamed protein product [Calicophoron daubneyi]|uniref:G-protein coupled receptors family 1 profile domain-containing protein n=1 Tax=Calicophoron daubneyi TaxID=300641 RepID=A0AAV2TVF4_CALDB